MRPVAALIRASHPEPGLAVTAVAAILAVVTGRALAGVAAVAATVLASQLAIGWVNDAIDAPRDRAVGRTDKPVATNAISARTVAICGAVAALSTVPLGLLSGVPAGLVAGLALISALLYDWPLKSTVASVVPYAVSFGALPAFVVLGSGSRPPVWLVAAGALLGAGAHFANVLPDLAADARTGVRGLPHRLGATGSLVTCGLLLVGATVALAVGPPGPVRWPGYAALAVAVVLLPVIWYVGTRAPESKVPFRLVMAIALLDVVLLVAGGTAV
jgi:4-hydroxybenzoate polyprenyltransferase